MNVLHTVFGELGSTSAKPVVVPTLRPPTTATTQASKLDRERTATTLDIALGVVAGVGAVVLTARTIASVASSARAAEEAQEEAREQARKARRRAEAAQASEAAQQASVPQPLHDDELGIPRRSVTVRVPATTANLGSGYDVIGMALDMWSEVTVELSDEFEVSVEGDGAENFRTGERGGQVVGWVQRAWVAVQSATLIHSDGTHTARRIEHPRHCRQGGIQKGERRGAGDEVQLHQPHPLRAWPWLVFGDGGGRRYRGAGVVRP